MLRHLESNDGEVMGEYEFNQRIRNEASALKSSLPIPIVFEDEKLCLGCIVITFFIPASRIKSVQKVWSKIMDCVHENIGYVRSGQVYKKTDTTTTITANIDLFEKIDLYQLQNELEIITECKACLDELVSLQKD